MPSAAAAAYLIIPSPTLQEYVYGGTVLGGIAGLLVAKATTHISRRRAIKAGGIGFAIGFMAVTILLTAALNPDAGAGFPPMAALHDRLVSMPVWANLVIAAMWGVVVASLTYLIAAIKPDLSSLFHA